MKDFPQHQTRFGMTSKTLEEALQITFIHFPYCRKDFKWLKIMYNKVKRNTESNQHDGEIRAEHDGEMEGVLQDAPRPFMVTKEVHTYNSELQPQQKKEGTRLF